MMPKNSIRVCLLRFLGILSVLSTALFNSCANTQPQGRLAEPSQSTSLTLIHNAKITTMDPRYPNATWMVLNGDRIEAIDQGLGPADLSRYRGARVRDAQGAFVMPAFIESHAHFLNLGRTLGSLRLMDCRDENALIEKVKLAAQTQAPMTWIEGRGWDQNRWPSQRFPHHQELSRATPNHPVILTRVDGHAVLVNALAMKMAGINADTKNPEGGEIIRGDDGEPTGVLTDKAMRLLASFRTQRGAADMRADAKRAQDACFEAGITSFHDAGVSRRQIALVEEMYRDQELKLNLYSMMAVDSQEAMRRAILERPESRQFDGRLVVRAVKLMLDGALGSRGAALIEDYHDRPHHRGALMLSSADLLAIGKQALAANIQVNTHAIGDRANQLVISSWSELFATAQRGREARFRIEHAQILNPQDIPAMAHFGMIASMQSVHCSSDMPWVPKRLGIARSEERAYIWRDVLRAGVTLCNGTDAPVESVSALECLYSALTRGAPEELKGQKEHCLTRLEALHSYTRAAAFASFQEQERGSLSPGKWADFIVLDRNLLTCSLPEFKAAQVVETWTRGERVFRR